MDTQSQSMAHLAMAWQASLPVRSAPNTVSEAFCRARLDGVSGHLGGSLPRGVDCQGIIDRAQPGIPGAN